MSENYYLKPGLPIAGGPSADGLDSVYWDGLKNEIIKIQRCNSCQAWQWGPECICHKCHSFDMGWDEVASEGIIYSWQRVWHPSHAVLKNQGPYLIVLVELPDADNCRVVGNLLGDPHQEVQIGATVCAYFEHHNDVLEPFTLLQWQHAE